MMAAGHWRGGLLFGLLTPGGTLQIELVVPGGYPWWPCNLLAGDPRYALGWADATRALNPALDWVGSWLLEPDNTLPSPAHCEAALRAWSRARLFVDYPLIALGLLDEVRSAATCRLIGGRFEPVPSALSD